MINAYIVKMLFHKNQYYDTIPKKLLKENFFKKTMFPKIETTGGNTGEKELHFFYKRTLCLFYFLVISSETEL